MMAFFMILKKKKKNLASILNFTEHNAHIKKTINIIKRKLQIDLKIIIQ
jgi:hypothetical protein